MSTSTILVSYNMSFASDAGTFTPISDNKFNNYPSEMSFLAQDRKADDDGDPRLFWKRASDLLFQFITENQEKKLVIGLQEMNKTTDGRTGSSYISNKLNEKFNNRFNNAIDELVVAQTQKPALMTIWDNSFGELDVNQIYELAQTIDSVDGSYNPNSPSNYESQFKLSKPLYTDINQTGRPIMFTYTTKGYLFINIHATNVAKDSADGYVKQLLLIQDKFALFSKLLKSNGKVIPSADNIYVVGDFNDRYNGLGNELNLSSDITLKFDGTAPLSCCHNLDSSCSLVNYTHKQWPNEKAIDCVIPEGYKPAGPREKSEIMLMRAQGNIENYRYYGDYCFSAFGGPLLKYPNERTGPSSESDHEMVYMVVNPKPESVSGGRRRRRTMKRSNKRRRVTKKRRGRKGSRSYRR